MLGFFHQGDQIFKNYSLFYICISVIGCLLPDSNILWDLSQNAAKV